MWKGLAGLWVPKLGPTGKTLFEWSKLHKNGTLVNMDLSDAWKMDSEGWSLEFYGVDDEVTTSWREITGTQSRTMMAVMKSTVKNSTIAGWGTDLAVGERWVWKTDLTTGAQRIEVQGGSSIGLTDLSDNTWRVIGHTFSGNNTTGIKQYINGIEESSTIISQWVNTTTTNPLSIGYDITKNNAHLTGSIALLAIWDRVLTDTEIKLFANDSLGIVRQKPKHFSMRFSVPIETSKFLPISWTSEINSFAQCGVSYIGELGVNIGSPVDWVNLSAQKFGIIPVEWGLVSAATTSPLSGGIWILDARGTTWVVDSRGTIWELDSRNTTWTLPVRY